MFDLWRQPEVCEYSGVSEDADGSPIDLPAASRAESDRLLHYWIGRSRAGTGLRWAVVHRDRSEFIGAIGFNALGECAEYATHFLPRVWGAGFASEAARLALDWVWSMGSRRVEAFILPDNLRSVQLVKRLGFERGERTDEGTIRFTLTQATGEPSSKLSPDG